MRMHYFTALLRRSPVAGRGAPVETKLPFIKPNRQVGYSFGTSFHAVGRRTNHEVVEDSFIFYSGQKPYHTAASETKCRMPKAKSAFLQPFLYIQAFFYYSIYLSAKELINVYVSLASESSGKINGQSWDISSKRCISTVLPAAWA
jgi:hypothetical protein